MAKEICRCKWSEGSASIQEMAEAAHARGYEYIAITDHPKGLKIAGGINEEPLRRNLDVIYPRHRALTRDAQALLQLLQTAANAEGRVRKKTRKRKR